MKGVYIFEKEPHSIFVLGDIHGDIDSLESLLNKAKEDELLVSLGDYTDRGDYGFEVVDKITQLQKENRIIALKGNHEEYDEYGNEKFAPNTFIWEITQKTGDWHRYFKNTYSKFLESLYVAAIIPEKFLLVHGGICDEIKTIEDLVKYEKFVLWADPYDASGMYMDIFTGRPKFGEDISEKVCESLGIKKIIRSHEPRKAREGPFIEHEGKVVTTSATTVYGGKAFGLRIYLEDCSEEVVYA